jgi:hypothetical protein
MRKFFGRILSVFCVLGIFIFTSVALSVSVVTAEQIYELTVICNSEKSGSIVGMEWKIYRVGERSGANSFTLTGDFSGYPVSMKKLTTTSAMQDAASTLATYATLDGISPLASGTTNENGAVSFEGLDAGIYLICGTTLKIGGNGNYTKYTPSPTLLEITAGSDETNFIIYPKISETTKKTASMAKYTVAKVWEDNDNAESTRPESVVILLYRDGEFDREVTLNAENDWKYSWDYDALPDWDIVEKDVPSGYSVVYRDNDSQFVLVNTYTKSEEPATEPPSHGVSEDNTNFPTEAFTSANETEASTISQITTGTVQPTSGTETTPVNTGHQEYATTASSAENTSVAGTTVPESGAGSSDMTVSTTSSTAGGTITTGNNGSSGGYSSGGSSSTKLPQTGQLWWPVPILTAVGLILIVIGTRLRTETR